MRSSTTTLSLCAAVALAAVAVSGAPMPVNNTTKSDVAAAVRAEVPALFVRDEVSGREKDGDAEVVKGVSLCSSLSFSLIYFLSLSLFLVIPFLLPFFHRSSLSFPLQILQAAKKQ